jgi:hypothetical protein
MAKFTKIFENGITTNILNFHDKEFKVTMRPTDTGEISDEQGFEEQLKIAFPGIDIDFDENDIDIDAFVFGADFEIQDALNQLEEIE